MVNLPSHYIEHGVETLITSPRFFGKIFGSGGGWVPIPGKPRSAAGIVSRWIEPALPPESGRSEQGVLRQHAAHPLVIQGGGLGARVDAGKSAVSRTAAIV